MEKLAQILEAAGQAPVPLGFPDGSRLLILPYGGRVLGLFPPDSEVNFLWTNPAFETMASARAFFQRDAWPNSGGDRTWLAPEIELFIGDLSRIAETYCVPRKLDPGDWQFDPSASHPALTNTVALELRRARRTAEVRIRKTLHPAANPLREASLADQRLEYAGYAQQITMEILPEPGTATPVSLGLWNLLQLPPPGEMLIPTYCPTTPQRVFGAVRTEDFTIGPHLVRWPMQASSDRKIAIKAGSLTGRAGYLYPAAGPRQWNLVVRQFAVDPSGKYVDALWDQPSERGYAFQACSVCAGTERFNELEYHAPAVTAQAGLNCRAEQSQVWAFRGTADAIATAAGILLGATNLMTPKSSAIRKKAQKSAKAK